MYHELSGAGRGSNLSWLAISRSYGQIELVLGKQSKRSQIEQGQECQGA